MAPGRGRTLLAFFVGGLAQCSASASAVWGERYTVRLALEPAALAPDAHGLGPRGAGDVDGETPEVHRVLFGGRPFQCRLPTDAEANRARRLHSGRHLATALAAPFAGQCLDVKDAEEESERERTQVPTQVCVGSHMQGPFGVATHDPSSNKAVPGGGFVQRYAGMMVGGQRFEATLRCVCRMPFDLMPPEPRCRLGDEVRLRTRPAAVRGVAAEEDRRASVLRIRSDGPLVLRFVRTSRGQVAVSSWSRSEVLAEDGRPCDAESGLELEPVVEVVAQSACDAEESDPAATSCSASPPPGPAPLAAAYGGLSPASGAAASPGPSALPGVPKNVTLAAVTCCGARRLRIPHPGVPERNVEFVRLLSPLIGRCLQVVSHWWTYEVCWPWRVRQMHVGIEGIVDAPANVLGYFRLDGRFELRRSTSSTPDAAENELATVLEGGPCSRLVQSWMISQMAAGDPHRLQNGEAAVGASFNPPGLERVQGVLVREELNPDGCKPFHRRLDGMVVLVSRGNCWFHTKASHAEAAGAFAVIIFNDRRQMVEVMEGVEEMRSPQIPALLVERPVGDKLLRRLDTHVVLHKNLEGSLGADRLTSTSLIFECNPEGLRRKTVCEVGDPVDVRLITRKGGAPLSQWPHSAVKVLRGVISEIFWHNFSAFVNWELLPTEDSQVASPSAVVDLNNTFRDGVPCNSGGSAFITRISEQQTCQLELAVHVPSLCAHRKLLPQPDPEPQAIDCLPEDPALFAAAPSGTPTGESGARAET